MTLRDAREIDLPAIVAIHNRAFPGLMAIAHTLPATVESRRDWFHQHNPSTRPLWVALENEVIAGWLSLQSFYGRAGVSCDRRVDIAVARFPDRRPKTLSGE